MFARITWSKLADSSQIDVAVAAIRDRILPSMRTQAGFLGLVSLANRETGEGMSGSYWQTADAMAASESMGTAGRTEVAQASGAEISEIDRFELILQDRAAPAAVGTFVRVNDLRASTAQIDETMDFMRKTALPTMRGLSGYRAMLVFVNRESGRMVAASVWNTPADREASESVIGALRRQAIDISKAPDVRITHYEAAFADVSPAAQEAATRLSVS